MNLSQFPPLFQRHLCANSYFSRQHHLFYVATPKVACTGLKWWFAGLLGMREAMAEASVSLESDPELVIHDTFARVAPDYTGANETGLLDALGSPEYLRFCVVRNPFTRVFSAWQSKWLLREPLQGNVYPEAPDDRAIETAEDIRAAFEAFLRVIAAVDDPARHDVHVAPQALLLDPQRVSYQVIGQIEDPTALVEALAARCGPGFRNPLAGGRANVSLLPYSSAWISDAAADLIRTIYADDFEIFGYDTAVPVGAMGLEDSALTVAFRSIKLLRGRNARIGDLSGRLAAQEASASVPSTLQMYWSAEENGSIEPYAEERSAFDVYPADRQRRKVSLIFSTVGPSVARLRLDPANQPMAILFHAFSLNAADGTLLWCWDGAHSCFGGIRGLELRDGPEGLMVACWDGDPRFELLIPGDVLAKVGPGAFLAVDMTPLPLLDVLPTLLAETAPTPSAPPAPALAASVAGTALAPVGLSRELVEVAQLMKTQIQRRNETIAHQRDELAAVQARQKALETQVVRAEAQLEVLKEFVLAAFGKANERV